MAGAMGCKVARLYAQRREASERYVSLWPTGQDAGQDSGASGQDRIAHNPLKNKPDQDRGDIRDDKTLRDELRDKIRFRRTWPAGKRLPYAYMGVIYILAVLTMVFQPTTARVSRDRGILTSAKPS